MYMERQWKTWETDLKQFKIYIETRDQAMCRTKYLAII